MTVLHQIEVGLTISAEEYLLLYKGVARDVLATSVDGRKVRFPAKILQPFVTHDGVKGRFVISFDAAGKFCDIHRIA